MEAIARALSDINAILDDGGHVDWQRARVARIFDTLERQLRTEMALRAPTSLCRTCGESGAKLCPPPESLPGTDH